MSSCADTRRPTCSRVPEFGPGAWRRRRRARALVGHRSRRTARGRPPTTAVVTRRRARPGMRPAAAILA